MAGAFLGICNKHLHSNNGYGYLRVHGEGEMKKLFEGVEMTNNGAYKIPKVTECQGYESLGSTEIRLDGLDSFLENAKDSKIDKIWSCYAPLCNKFKTADGKFPDFERMDYFAEIFFFVVNKVIYSVESDGYRSLYDYINAKEMGFLDPRVYSLMNEVSKKYKVKSVASLYYTAVNDGFKNLVDFADSFNFYDDYKSFSTYQKEHYLSAKLGFKKKYDWEIAESKGFKNPEFSVSLPIVLNLLLPLRIRSTMSSVISFQFCPYHSLL